jgi:uncharacterized protein (DUF433 family)
MEVNITNHVDKNNNVCGGRACISGTRIRVQDIYVWHELQGKSPDEIVSDFPQLNLAQVHSALAYYWDHKDEIHQEIKDAEDLLQRLKLQSPSPLREKLAQRGTDAGSNQIPS